MSLSLFCPCFDGEEERKGSVWSNYLEEEHDCDEIQARNASLTREKKIVQHHKANKHRRRHHGTIFARPLDLEQNFEIPIIIKSQNDRTFIHKALMDNFIFSHLVATEMEMLINAMEQEIVDKGTNVISQGEVTEPGSDFFYILQEGTIDFIVDDVTVGNCEPGESFGELALLYDSPRATTCRAVTQRCVLWKVNQKTFRHMLARQAHESQAGVCSTVRKIPLLEHLGPTHLHKFADALTPVSYTSGERIVTKGEHGEVFYIIQQGTVKCHEIGLGEAQYAEQLILKEGDWFGELALLTGEPRAASVTAVTDVVCLTMDRETFESSIGCLKSIIDNGMKKKLLQTLPIFTSSKLVEYELNDLAHRMTEVCSIKGQHICKAGEPSQHDFWIIRHGKIVVTDTTGSIFVLVSGDYFGDKSIKEDIGHISSETAIFEENSECFVLSRSDIEQAIGDINRLGEPLPFKPSKVNRSLGIDDITVHRILGMGAFGTVWLATTKKDNTSYALKQMNKLQLIESQQVKSVHNEKNIMFSLEHPFLMSLISSFQDDDHIYLLLELIQGGELFNVLHSEKSDGVPNSHAIFYAACVIEALGHLHQRSICYRDLKPENIMIGADGYCTIVDMGFSKVVHDKTYTLCGTPEYLAPEIIMSKGHNKGADYWSFGVLLYEMLVGISPFYDALSMDQISLFKRIVLVKYQIPSDVNEDGQDLIKKLLVRRQASRLGNLSGGHRDIQNHVWFKDITWKKLLRKEMTAPWLPQIKDPFDASHFDNFHSQSKRSKNLRRLTSREQLLFKEF